MLKEAIEKIETMTKPVLQEIDGHTFCICNGGDVTEIRPEIDMQVEKRLHSLDALVKMVKTETLEISPVEGPVYIEVPDVSAVYCFSHPTLHYRCDRLDYFEVVAKDVPGWQERTALKFDEAIIALRTRFQPTPDAEYALKLLSEITTGSKVTLNDNGIATSITTHAGIALQQNEPIRPIVTLKPYRTFQEVDQPASQFLIRIDERNINFIEADGGMWRLEARKTIKKYFDEAFADEIADGKVVVML